MAEDGASFLDVHEWYRTEGYDEDECFANARRVFRGGLVQGGAPFTKDACYLRGLVLDAAFVRAAFEQGRAELVPYLFVGKVAHEDIPALWDKAGEGIVRPPVYLPPIVRDPNGLAVCTVLSGFPLRIGDGAVDRYYADLVRGA